ncbi:MAG: S-adenosylmethionine:tRNA ribosyltransferase-isomerase [Thermoplasmata archaeon]|nr:S-adenosylmethionine:tRNA ribosyltransferase-isomerase [Thermoplasmata archaeon]
MKREALGFDRPAGLEAHEPPEQRGLERDQVRLMVSDSAGDHDGSFHALADWLQPNDLLVVNGSATLAAAVPAESTFGPFRMHLSTDFGRRLWLAEPRWSFDRPGPLPIERGMQIRVGPCVGAAIEPYPGQPRLWFVRFDADPREAMSAVGEPIRYGYARGRFPIEAYQTIFARVPGSAEMPSAGRPFTLRVLEALRARGVSMATVLLHTGVSSLEVSAPRFEEEALLPEPFEVAPDAIEAVRAAHAQGGRVIAVGTTVARALEAAAGSGTLRASSGFTRRKLQPGDPLRVIDGLLTGFHDPFASHLALLFAVAGQPRVHRAYRAAVERGYLWHEFGDSHLWLPGPRHAG